MHFISRLLPLASLDLLGGDVSDFKLRLLLSYVQLVPGAKSI